MTASMCLVLIFIFLLIAPIAPRQGDDRVRAERATSAAREPTALDARVAPPGPGIDPASRRAGADKGWWQTVSARLAREEYYATSNAGGIQAPNRAHNLRTNFRAGGIEVVPREGDAAAGWRFSWETARFGRPGALRAVEAASPEPDGSRVTYRRSEFDEWYANSHAGLEQGFTVHAPPPGEGPLCITGRLAGPVRTVLQPKEGAVDLLDGHGSMVLRYGELHVWDADGNELPSRLGLDGAELAILVEDDGASYPLTVDPLMTSPAWSAESQQPGAHFGTSVATAGDVNGDGFSDAIVGAPGYDNGNFTDGKVFVYHGSAAGLAITPAWTAESDEAQSDFGRSVATAGDVNGDGFSDVILGAPSFGAGDRGRALVYHGSAAGLAATPAWTTDGDPGGEFGRSVATAGDVNGDGFSDVIVGAWIYDNGESNEGRAFVYHGSAVGLAATPAWTAESDQAGAEFGYSVATAGDVNGDGFSDVIVGADRYDNGQSNEGRAFVYHGSAAGLVATPAWTAESNQVSAEFGISVATAGDVNGDGFSDVIVGAWLYDFFQTDEGRAYVYHGSAAGLAATAAWTAESNQDDARFGASAATAGDVNGDGFADVIVGAHGDDDSEGRASVYQGSAVGLASTSAWTAESDRPLALYGQSVATVGDVNGDGFSDVIVGVPGFNLFGEGEGAALVYHGSAAGPATTAAWTTESDQADAEFGLSVATAGDVNGDGYSDVIVGAYLYDNGQIDEGRAFVYHGSAAGIATTAAWTGESNQAGASFGISVATAGDVNGDGFSDVIVGAHQYDNGQTDEGRAFVYHGSAAGLAATAAWTAESNQASASLGSSVATAGDVNGDGFSDVIVGAPEYDNGQTDEGRALVYHGSAAGLATTAAWTAESNQAGAVFGISVATAGDVNGDGFSDVIAGAYLYDNGQTDEGRTFVYHGSATGLVATADWTAESNQAAALFGEVATAGDVNGDGFSDVIVGAFFYGNGQSGEGRAFVYHGTAAGLAATAAWTAESDQVGARFGASVATAGDANGDGFSDVIVGAYLYDNGEIGEGQAFAYNGSAAGLSTAPAWTARSNQADASFGISVATAGDVNGDGFSDVIVGARDYDNGATDEGRTFVYYGNGGSCRRTLPRQQRIDGVTPIALLGLSDSETQFRIRGIMLSIYGRTRLQMEHEVKPHGVPFDGLNTAPGNFFDIGNDGEINFSRLVSGLTAGTQYHWRVRAKYDLAKTPFQRNGPWVHVPINGWNEADLRMAGTTTGIEMAEAPRPPFLLEAPRPNPFGRSADIGYTLPLSGRVRLAVYDVTGRERRVLVDAVQGVGRQVATWNGRDARDARMAAGVYWVRLAFDGRNEARKLVLAP